MDEEMEAIKKKSDMDIDVSTSWLQTHLTQRGVQIEEKLSRIGHEIQG